MFLFHLWHDQSFLFYIQLVHLKIKESIHLWYYVNGDHNRSDIEKSEMYSWFTLIQNIKVVSYLVVIIISSYLFVV